MERTAPTERVELGSGLEPDLPRFARSFSVVALGGALVVASVLAVASVFFDAGTPRVLAAGALGLAILAGWQIETHRHQPGILLAFMLGVTTILYRPFVSETLLLGTVVALSVLAALSIPFIPERYRRSYLIILAGCWASQLFPDPQQYDTLLWEPLAERAIVMGIQLVIFLTLVVAIKRIDLRLGQADRRFRMVYERIPIAIWNEDFTEVGAWLEELRATGIDDLRAHLTAHPELVDSAATMIRIRGANPAAVKMLGLGDDDGVTDRIDPSTFTAETRESLIDQLEAVWLESDFIVTPVVGRTVDGNRLDGLLHWTAARGPEGLKLDEVIVAIDDVTEAKAAERAKADFLAKMSHELRTPLNAILGMTELTLGTELSADQREYMGTIKTSVDALVTLVNDILDISRVEAGKLRMSAVPFSLRDVLGETMVTLNTRAERKGLAFRHELDDDVPDALVGDPGRLRQILFNLIGNALKFTNVGHVEVRVGIDEISETDVKLHFEVADTGIGIDAADQESIFEPFEQGDGSSTRRFGGTGLGLAITQDLASRMNGGLWCESAIGRGSTFHFTAVLRRQEQNQYLSMPGMDTDITGARILVVDESPSRARILVEMLRDGGFVPVVVGGPEEALRLVERSQLQEMDLRAVAVDLDNDPIPSVEALRAHPEFAALPLVVITTSGSRGDGAVFSELGASAYLTHPLDALDVVEALTLAVSTQDGNRPIPLITRHWLREQRRLLHILVADDSPTNRLLATKLLEKRGHQVTAVEDGRGAVEAVAAGDFDLVLMDIQMPEMDGLEATTAIRLRESETGGHIPIVALTAHAADQDRELCISTGMDAYLAKPFKAHEFYAVIEQLARHFDTQPAEPKGKVDHAMRPGKSDDLEIQRLLIDVFLAGYDEARSALANAIAVGDFEAAAAVSHRLKGEFGALEHKAGFAAAKELEHAARSALAGDVDARWLEFDTLMRNSVIPELSAVGTRRHTLEEARR